MSSLARRDFVSSVVLHGAIILIALNWTPILRETPPKFEPLPVELVPVSELTRLLKRPSTEPVESNEAEPVQEAPKPAPAVQKIPPPQASPSKTLDPSAPPELAAPAAKAEPAAETPSTEVSNEPSFAVATPIPQARPAPQKPKLDVTKLRLLLDKTPDTPVTSATADAEVEKMTLSEIDRFRAQMVRCWSFPAGARQGENLAVIVSLSLAPTGMVSEGPVVLNRSRLNDPFYRAAAESVLRAIRRCQPYQMPAEKYEQWRNLELNFDPQQMLGG